MSTTLLNTSIQRNPNVVSHELADGDSVLLHLESGSYHGLNSMGSIIWGLIDGTRTGEELRVEVLRGLVDAPADLDAIVGAFLAELHARDLIIV